MMMGITKLIQLKAGVLNLDWESALDIVQFNIFLSIIELTGGVDVILECTLE